MIDVYEFSKRRSDKLVEVHDSIRVTFDVALEEAKACDDYIMKGKFLTIATSLCNTLDVIDDMLEIEVEELKAYAVESICNLLI